MPDARCEVILYAPEHDATFWSLGAKRARRVVDLWAERSAALGARPDIAYVLVFENRGESVGATIPHPHGQIYAFDFVPDLPRRELELGDTLDEPGDRLVAGASG
jgi:UDPglucose--hexose-1-phosphate uridylyltransferase